MFKIENTHKENFSLIRKNNLKVGSVLKLKIDYLYFKKGDLFKISFIHSLYGWVSFKETEQLPQDVKEILNILNLKK